MTSLQICALLSHTPHIITGQINYILLCSTHTFMNKKFCNVEIFTFMVFDSLITYDYKHN